MCACLHIVVVMQALMKLAEDVSPCESEQRVCGYSVLLCTQLNKNSLFSRRLSPPFDKLTLQLSRNRDPALKDLVSGMSVPPSKYKTEAKLGFPRIGLPRCGWRSDFVTRKQKSAFQKSYVTLPKEGTAHIACLNLLNACICMSVCS